jgi:hypothetical protein
MDISSSRISVPDMSARRLEFADSAQIDQMSCRCPGILRFQAENTA